MVSAPTLHYLYDPLCGWCWGAAPLLQAASELPGVELRLHGGGLFAGAARRPVTPELRAYVGPHDRRIAELSGQSFGSRYIDGLLKDPGAMLDSEPPITAVLAAQDLEPQAGPALLARIQRAHYVEGQHIAEPMVLSALAREQGLDGAAFEAAYQRLAGAPTRAHLRAARELLRRAGGQGFPSLVLEQPDRPLRPLEIGLFYGRRQAWQLHLRQALIPA